MHIDYRNSPLLNEEERSLVRTLLRARAVAVVAVLAGIVAIGLSTAAHDPELASAPDGAAQDATPTDPGLAALERGVIG